MRTLLFILVLPVCAWSQKSPGRSAGNVTEPPKIEIPYFKTDSFVVLLSQARSENKLIFIDGYTTWCGPCKWMERNVFTNDTVAQFYSEHFICTRIDMEHGEGPLIAKRYSVFCYPQYLFLDGNGMVVHRGSGAQPVGAFLSLGQIALSPDTRFDAVERTYRSGAFGPQDFIRYLLLRQASCLPTDSLVMQYEQSLQPHDMTNRMSWSLLVQFIRDPRSRLFLNMLRNSNEYAKLYTQDSVETLIEGVCQDALMRQLWKTPIDTMTYQTIQRDLRASGYPMAERICMRADIDLYGYLKQWDRCVAAATVYIKRYGENADYHLLNNCAWMVYLHRSNTEELNLALLWAQRSVALAPQSFNTDTYAALLYKLGRYAEAKTWAEISIKLGKEVGVDITETENLLQMIKEKLNQ